MQNYSKSRAGPSRLQRICNFSRRRQCDGKSVVLKCRCPRAYGPGRTSNLVGPHNAAGLRRSPAEHAMTWALVTSP